MFNWYYARLYIKVRPERVFVWPRGNAAEERRSTTRTSRRSVQGTSRSGGRSRASRHRPRRPGTGAWSTWPRTTPACSAGWAPTGPDRGPRPVTADGPHRSRSRSDAFRRGLPLLAGRACLAVHEHAPYFTWQRNMQVRGTLEPYGDGWRLVPRRIVGGFEIPPSTLGATGTSSRRGRASTGPIAGV